MNFRLGRVENLPFLYVWYARIYIARLPPSARVVCPPATTAAEPRYPYVNLLQLNQLGPDGEVGPFRTPAFRNTFPSARPAGPMF